MPRLAAALDVFSLSSYCESFPNVVGEAMACAVPCVVTDVGDAAWIVGDTGRVVPPRDPGALAEAWAEMLNLGRDGRAALGRAALSRVGDYFPVKAIVQHYETLYEAVLTERAPDECPVTVLLQSHFKASLHPCGCVAPVFVEVFRLGGQDNCHTSMR